MFGSPKKAPPDPKALVKANKKQVTRSQHEIQREIMALERQERETIAEMKRLAAKNQTSSLKILAKQIVNIRNQKERLQKSHAHLNTLKTVGSTVGANIAVTNAVTGAARAMTAANQLTNPEGLSQTIQEMQKQQMITDLTEEMLDELLEDDLSEEEEEADAIVSEVFDEIEIDLESNLVSPPTKAMASSSSLKEHSSSKSLTDEEEREADKILAQITGL